MIRPTVVALYLPQYHPIAENDEWWGKGFTEWTNVTKARPMYSGHPQPDLPADLGFYDLRVPETRLLQAEMARDYGVDAFCYYHYWFGNGRRLLHQPFDAVLKSGQPDHPFMLCWANQTWSGVWHGLNGNVLIEQKYPGKSDHEAHFESLLPAFRDSRYLKVNEMPVFNVYAPTELPESVKTLELWRAMAREAGLPGIYFIGTHHTPDWDARSFGYDAYVKVAALQRRRQWVPWRRPLAKIGNRWLDFRGRPTILDYASEIDNIIPKQLCSEAIPCVLPNWDNTPRSGARGLVLHGSTPKLFGRQLQRAMSTIATRRSTNNLLFVKSWNEWAEGNHLEPCQRFGRGYLDELKRNLDQYNLI